MRESASVTASETGSVTGVLTCEKTETAASKKRAVKEILVSIAALGDDNGVVRLNPDVLRRVPALNDLFIVERQPTLAAIRGLPQNIN